MPRSLCIICWSDGPREGEKIDVDKYQPNIIEKRMCVMNQMSIILLPWRLASREYLLGVLALLLLLSLFPYLSVLTNIVAMDRVLIHFPLLRSSPSQLFDSASITANSSRQRLRGRTCFVAMKNSLCRLPKLELIRGATVKGWIGEPIYCLYT